MCHTHNPRPKGDVCTCLPHSGLALPWDAPTPAPWTSLQANPAPLPGSTRLLGSYGKDNHSSTAVRVDAAQSERRSDLVEALPLRARGGASLHSMLVCNSMLFSSHFPPNSLSHASVSQCAHFPCRLNVCSVVDGGNM